MNKLIPYALVLVAVLLGAVYYMGAGQTAGMSPEELAAPRENSEGMVTVGITFLNPTSSQYTDSLAFQVSMNTHSVNLDSYDPIEIAYIKTSSGQVIKPTSWDEADGSGGHHRRGLLIFPMNSELEMGGFEIVVEGIAGIDQRIFSW